MSKFIPKNMTPLSVIAKNALYEALSFGLPGRSSFSGLGQSDTGGDPLMNRIVSGGRRPLGGIEVPSGLDAGGGFKDTLGRMGYKSTVDPETGKEQLLAPRKETGKKLEQSPISFSGGRGTGVRRPERMPSAASSTQEQPKKEESKDRVLSSNEQGNIRREMLGGKERNTYGYYKGQTPSKGMEYRYSEKDEFGRNRDIYTMGGTNPRL
jgi:hypothetical protein